tara:strand:+ start:10595 stop:11131 length:537 start_codon:yes stop_codon:yes gene_type:complete
MAKMIRQDDEKHLRGKYMQGKRVLVRETLLQDEAARIVGILPDITTWTSWMKSTTHIISSTQNTLVQGDEFELQRIVKGALVQEKWTVKSTRGSDSKPLFYELEISLDGQTRLGKNVGGAIKSLQMTITILSDKDQSGIEIYIDYSLNKIYSLASRWVRTSVESMAKIWMKDVIAILN